MEHRSARQYDPVELERFARYIENRAACRPRKCRGGGSCWVSYGPPAITSKGTCIGCHEKPLGIAYLAGNGTSYARP
jgi:hypothetical protein